MERVRNANERVWNANGTRSERVTDAFGTQMERERLFLSSTVARGVNVGGGGVVHPPRGTD